MEVVICPDVETIGRLAGGAVAEVVRSRPDPVLGLATGSSPTVVYDELRRIRADEGLDLSRVRGFALDEYVGLPVDHPQRYATVLESQVRAPLGLAPGGVTVPDGCAEDLPEACRRFEEAIDAAGGVDLQLLGIGTDGHIAFNEPGSSLSSRTRVKTLTRQTRRDNARFFGGDPDVVPRHCLTQGLGTILEARHVVLVAMGRRKAEAVHQMVEGPVSAMWPASVLQLHRHVTVLLDEGAASRLQLAAYYRETWSDKPAWQAL